MTFEEYLISKKIDLKAFQQNENDLFETWKLEFAQMHPNSFTAQKLYLINPIRRKYTLTETSTEKKNVDVVIPPVIEAAIVEQIENTAAKEETIPKPVQPVKPPRPVFKPKPKIT